MKAIELVDIIELEDNIEILDSSTLESHLNEFKKFVSTDLLSYFMERGEQHVKNT